MTMATKRFVLGWLVTGLFILCTPLGAADWLTFAHDPQRSGWAFEEATLSAQNVAGLELKWKAQVKNEPRSLTALTAPVVAEGVSTPQGVKTLVFVAGSSNQFFALDAEPETSFGAGRLRPTCSPKTKGCGFARTASTPPPQSISLAESFMRLQSMAGCTGSI